MAQQGQQYAHEKIRPAHAPPNATPPPHDPHHGMKPWLQRTIIGLSVTMSVSGITAFTTIILDNQRSVAALEARIQDAGRNWERFVDVRYPRDHDDLEAEIIELEVKIERIREEMRRSP